MNTLIKWLTLCTCSVFSRNCVGNSVFLRKNWYGMERLEMGVFNLIQNWILESHYRGREIYQVQTAAFGEG